MIRLSWLLIITIYDNMTPTMLGTAEVAPTSGKLMLMGEKAVWNFRCNCGAANLNHSRK